MNTPSENQDYCNLCKSIALKTSLKANEGICQRCKREKEDSSESNNFIKTDRAVDEALTGALGSNHKDRIFS